MIDSYDEILELPPDNHFQVSNMYIDDLILYLTSDEFKVFMYMLRNISGRRTWAHHSLAISVLVNGRQLDKSFCVGVGMKEALVRKCLQSLVFFGFIVPLGVPTLAGQNWKIGSKIKMGELRKRLDEKLNFDVEKIQKARLSRGKKEDTPLVRQNPSCETEPLLSDKRPPVLSHKTTPLLSDKTQRKTEERQKKDRDIALASDDAAHTPAPTTQTTFDPAEMPHTRNPGRYASVSVGDEQKSTQDEKAKGKGRKTKTPPPPVSAEPPAPKEASALEHNRAIAEALGKAWGVMPAGPDYGLYIKRAKKLIDGGVPVELFKTYCDHQKRKAGDFADKLSIGTITENGRLSEFLTWWKVEGERIRRHEAHVQHLRETHPEYFSDYKPAVLASPEEIEEARSLMRSYRKESSS